MLYYSSTIDPGKSWENSSRLGLWLTTSLLRLLRGCDTTLDLTRFDFILVLLPLFFLIGTEDCFTKSMLQVMWELNASDVGLDCDLELAYFCYIQE